MWELFVVCANVERAGDSYSFDEKPQSTRQGSKTLVFSGTLDGRAQEVWLNLDNIAGWWILGPSQQ
jgi:hypothetical protein